MKQYLEVGGYKMESEKTIYRILLAIVLLILCMLLLLIKPANVYYNAIDFILVIAAIIVEVKIYLQLRKLKNKRSK